MAAAESPKQPEDEAPDLGGLTHRREARELGRDVIMTEIGTVGLDISGGRVRESRLQNFKGVNRAKVIREMAETDAIVKGLLSNYTMLAQSAERTVVAGGTTPGDDEAADFIDESLDDMEISWQDNLSAIFSMLPHGFSYHEVNFKLRLGGSPPGDAPESKHDDGKIGWWGWPIRLQETIDRWDLDDNGRVRGAFQRPKSFRVGEVKIPIEKALHFRTSAKRGNPDGESMLESAYRSWFAKRNFEELLGIGIKRDLTGLLTLSVPKAWAIWHQSNVSKRQELETLVANVQRDEYEGLVMPDDVKATLLSSGGQRQFNIMEVLKQLWLEIAIATLTDFALIGHENIGARSLKEESARIFLIALQGILDNVADTINRFAIPTLVRLNGFSVTKMPELKFTTVDVPNVDKIVDTLAKLTNAGAEVFPNTEIMEVIFGHLRLPIDEMGENLDEGKERREKMLENNPLMQPGGTKKEDDDEEESKAEEEEDEEDESEEE